MNHKSTSSMPALMLGAALTLPATALAVDTPELYGALDLSWDNVEGDGNVGTVSGPHQQEINSHQSRIGVRGDQPLSLVEASVFYQLEYQLQPERTSGLVNRESFLGLRHDHGTLRVGRFNTPVAELGRMVDQFSDYQWADIGGLLRGQVRGRNHVEYASPRIADMMTFTIAGPTSEGDSVNDSAADNRGLWDAFSASLLFDLGDIRAGLGYDHNVFQTSVAGDGSFTSGSYAPANLETRLAENSSVDIVRFVVAADIDALELGFLYQNARANASSGNLGPLETEAEEDSLVLSAGYELPLELKLRAQYAETAAENLPDSDHAQWALGVDHNLGDRTTAYAYATQRQFDRDRDVGVFTLGARHRF